MINNLRFQFNYLFSKVFVFSLLAIIIGTFSGIIISSNIDLGYNFLDGFIIDYRFDYMFQSLLIIEIVSVVVSVFVAGVLGSKNNDNLICYTCNSYYERFIYFIARIIILLFFSFLFISLVGMFMFLFTRGFTPYRLDRDLVVNGLFAVFFISVYFSMFTMTFLVLINHFIVVSIPFFVFWYLKTIYDFSELKSEVQEVLLKIFPSFIVKGHISYYQDIYVYILIFIGMFLFCIIISTIKDY